MDMEENHDHQRQAQEQEQDSMGDLSLMRDFINMNSALPTSTATHFPSISLQQPTPLLFPPHPNFNFNNINMTAPFATSLSHSAPLNTHPPTTPLEHSTTHPSLNFPRTAPADASTPRWPRQETLSLLHIRSRLHPNFKLANQKAPLWDQLSRMMWEEYGYQRSGKKCREKFENLYKYYKKTKEGKAGRQDGKHYRFFRQLEALCGENSNLSEPNLESHETKNEHSVSTELETSSSELENNDYDWRRRWRKKVKEMIDSQMKEVMEKQEAWVERVMKRLEEKEKERVMREEEWSREEAARIEREHKFWAKERAWIEARDAALMDALQKLTPGINTELLKPQPLINIHPAAAAAAAAAAQIIVQESWEDSEITTLLQMVESHEEAVWEEVATKMACFGYHKTASMCKHKWETITNYYPNNRKDNSTRSFNYFHHNNTDLSNSLYNINQPTPFSNVNQPQHPHASSPPANADTCFPFFMCPDTQNLCLNYGFNLNKPNQNP